MKLKSMEINLKTKQKDTTMRRKFELDGYEIATYFNLRAKLTLITIVKDDKVLMNEAINKPPFAIDYADLIENL